ncbi:Uncharacterised protein [Mycobacteroides abscessus subsp. abscessus]|uniref:Uncharacterized protein n=1 Tax=Mycobacteroides abscessus subsp. abscessus TaxID=1185650 RepID=A0AB38CZK0_9MYCO|nr:hypothetical protein [Mycobacteroides abscessus]SHW42828.1 Uncharacterised protein [Mycobacteroides abscessus subsp. abscessus]SIA23989.1 Uncharacterised protein [Mycobacteroides abscessus subsp. abscessus]SIB00811.1 Uncharacterised protein [Mycobacteroides abscessus subsp. abscessus]SIB04085.1 Uncharacterised protein [Mycobacteroides abscessus subsp. abscessus]SIB08030.1 Uncharacterised protein [Mycobacteroides abscessus subsp. abscessus]
MTSTELVLQLVAAERQRQQDKWGEQNHQNINPDMLGYGPMTAARFYCVPTAAEAKMRTDSRARCGHVTWADILIEEVAEAIEAATLLEDAIDVAGYEQTARRVLIDELVQVAAVAVQWAEKLDGGE